MRFILFLITLYIFIKTVLYGIFEIKKEQNIYGGSAVILVRYTSTSTTQYHFIL